LSREVVLYDDAVPKRGRAYSYDNTVPRRFLGAKRALGDDDDDDDDDIRKRRRDIQRRSKIHKSVAPRRQRECASQF